MLSSNCDHFVLGIDIPSEQTFECKYTLNTDAPILLSLLMQHYDWHQDFILPSLDAKWGYFPIWICIHSNIIWWDIDEEWWKSGALWIPLGC